MLERSATSPSTGTPRSPSIHGSSSTMPKTVNGTSGASLAVCARSAAHVLVPTTSTRRLAANWCRHTTSQTVVRQKTDTAITKSAETGRLERGSGTQSVTAEPTTSPVTVPTLAGTAGPSVKGTAPNALRSVKSHTIASSDAKRRATAGESIRPALTTKTGTQIVTARPSSATHLTSADLSSPDTDGRNGGRTARPPEFCARAPTNLLPCSQTRIYPRLVAVSPCSRARGVPSLFRAAHSPPRVRWRR